MHCIAVLCASRNMHVSVANVIATLGPQENRILGHANLGQSFINTEAARTALARDAGIEDLRCTLGLKLEASVRAAGMQVQHPESSEIIDG